MPTQPQNKGAGSLIEIHAHGNFDVIEKFSEKNGELYYNNVKIFTNTAGFTNKEIEDTITAAWTEIDNHADYQWLKGEENK